MPDKHSARFPFRLPGVASSTEAPFSGTARVILPISPEPQEQRDFKDLIGGDEEWPDGPSVTDLYNLLSAFDLRAKRRSSGR